MLSRKAKYALKATLMLAREHGQGPVLISEIAQKEKIPKKFLELILLDLKNHGILQSKKGKGGGYFLGKSPESITFGAVVRIMDGPLALIPCVSLTAYRKCDDCIDEKTCGIWLIMQEVRDNTARVLDGTTIRDVLNRLDRKSPKAKEPGDFLL